MKNGKKNSKVIKAILVFCVMEDDAIVPVDFAPGHAPMVAGYLRHIHGGKIRLREEKVLVVNDTDAMRRAINVLEAGKAEQGNFLWLRECYWRLKSRYDNLRHRQRTTSPEANAASPART